MNLRTRHAAGLAVIALLLLPAPAFAAPPANDDRATPTTLGSLPAQASGTTVEATRLPNDHYSSCGPEGGQVWLRLTASADGRVACGSPAAARRSASSAPRSTRPQIGDFEGRPVKRLGCDEMLVVSPPSG